MQIYRSLDEVVEAGTIAPDSIVNADCLEAMKLIADKSVDAIVCDLPYGITNCHWDSVIPFDLLWEQYKRIIKPNGAIALFGNQPFTSALVMSNPKWFKWEDIWHKSQATGHLNCRRMPMREHENILVFGVGKVNFYPQMAEKKKENIRPAGPHASTSCYGVFKRESGRSIPLNMSFPRSVTKINNTNHGERGFHPTQKPVALIEYLLKTYTIEGELVLDNTAGSGTLAIAAINTNRRYICIEKDPDYFEVMRKRIEDHDPNALATPKKAKKPRAITEGQLALFC
jgi:site-specific DNA-methyltransferase (adenine-specific)